MTKEVPIEDHRDASAGAASHGHGHGQSSASSSSSAASYAGAVNTAKHRLSVCLKLLGIMYRSDDECSPPDGEQPLPPGKPSEQSHVWPAEARGDQLYLAMVMLNSSLLKALHVADSFHMHCQQEYPKLAALHRDNGSTSYIFDDGRSVRSDGSFCCQEYRRLQAECFVLFEAGWSLEQQRDSDKDRMRQLEDDCRQLRAVLTKAAQPPSLKQSAKAEPKEVGDLRSFGVNLDWRPDGTATIAETELQRLVSVFQIMGRTVQDARADAAGAGTQADNAAERAADAKREREELRNLIGGGAAQGNAVLHTSVSQLLNEITECEAVGQREQEQKAMREQLRELHAQDAALEQQCNDLAAENSRLHEAMAAANLVASNSCSGLEHEASERELLKDAETGAPKEGATQLDTRRNGAVAGSRSGGGGGGIQQLQRTRSSAVTKENTIADSLATPEATIAAAAAGPESRNASRGRAGQAGQPRASKVSKPFVVSASKKSSQTAVNGPNVPHRRGAETLPEERQFAEAALRYAKNPGDTEALSKLANLLQKRHKDHNSSDAKVSETDGDAKQDLLQPRAEAAIGSGPAVVWPTPTPSPASEPLRAERRANTSPLVQRPSPSSANNLLLASANNALPTLPSFPPIASPARQSR